MPKVTKKNTKKVKKEKVAEEANFSSNTKKIKLIDKIKEFLTIKKQTKIIRDFEGKTNINYLDVVNIAVDNPTSKKHEDDLLIYTLRLIKSTKSRFASLLFITLLGSAFLMGLSSVSPIMEHTFDLFSDDNNLFDIQIYSNYGFSDDDLEAISNVDGVQEVEGSKYFDCYEELTGGGKACVRIQELESTINSLTLKEGRWPENENECVALYSKHGDFNSLIGSQVYLTRDTDDELDEYISSKSLTIVGLIETPQYMTYVSESSTFHNLTIQDVFFVPNSAFRYEYYTVANVTIEGADNYNSFKDNYEDYISKYISKLEILAETQKDSNRNAIVAKAQAKLDDAQAELDYEKQVGQARLDAAKAQLSVAYAKLLMASSTIDATEQVIDNLEDMYDAKKSQISSGTAKLEDAKKEVETKTGQDFETVFTEMSAIYAIYNGIENEKTKADDQVAAYKQKVQDELNEYQAALEANQDAQDALMQQLSEIINEISFLNRASLEAQYPLEETPVQTVQEEKTVTEIIETQSLAGDVVTASEGNDVEETPGNEETPSSEEDTSNEVETSQEENEVTLVEQVIETIQPQIIDYASLIESKKNSRIDIISQIVDLKADEYWLEVKIQIDEKILNVVNNVDGEAIRTILETMQSGLERITNVEDIEGSYGWMLEIKTDEIKIEASNQVLEETRKQVTESEDEIEQAATEVATGTIQYEAALNQYTYQEEEFNKTIEEAQTKLDKAQQDLDDLSEGQWTIIDRNSHISSVFVGESAKQMKVIGTAIPIMFFLVAILVCMTTMTRLIEEKRSEIGGLLSIGYSKQEIIKEYVRYAFISSFVGSLIGTILGLFTLPKMIYTIWQLCYRIPDMKFYVPVFNFIISILSFVLLMCFVTYLVMKTNLEESPACLLRPKAPKNIRKTFIENIDSIWSRLTLTGKITARNIIRYKQRFFMTIFGIAGCVALLILGFGLKDSIKKIPTHFGEILHYTHDLEIEDEEYGSNFIDYINKNYEDSNPVSVLFYNSNVRSTNEESIFLIYVIGDDEVDDFVTLKEFKSGKKITLDDTGVAISNKYATTNDVQIGDSLIIESADGIKKEATVSHIFECYVYDDIVMTDSYYQKIFGVNPNHKDIYFTYNGEEGEPTNELSSMDGYVSLKSNGATNQAINNLVNSLNLVIVIVITFAGMLAFVVLINLTEVNISERKRELATLKVLGFSKIEVRNYIFKELIILTIIGAILGIPLGYAAHAYLISIINYNRVFIPTIVKFSSVLISLCLTFFFLFLILLVEIKPIKDIKMVESLKSVE